MALDSTKFAVSSTRDDPFSLTDFDYSRIDLEAYEITFISQIINEQVYLIWVIGFKLAVIPISLDEAPSGETPCLHLLLLLSLLLETNSFMCTKEKHLLSLRSSSDSHYS